MTIHDPAAFVNGLWDWGILNGCFGDSRIAPTDMDGLVMVMPNPFDRALVERKGKFLLLETKQPGVEIPVGQHLMFEALCNTGAFCVFVIWGRKNEPEQLQIYDKSGFYPVQQCDLMRLREAVTNWYLYAQGKL